jgi:hypothetical protein
MRFEQQLCAERLGGISEQKAKRDKTFKNLFMRYHLICTVFERSLSSRIHSLHYPNSLPLYCGSMRKNEVRRIKGPYLRFWAAYIFLKIEQPNRAAPKSFGFYGPQVDSWNRKESAEVCVEISEARGTFSASAPLKKPHLFDRRIC